MPQFPEIITHRVASKHRTSINLSKYFAKSWHIASSVSFGNNYCDLESSPGISLKYEAAQCLYKHPTVNIDSISIMNSSECLAHARAQLGRLHYRRYSSDRGEAVHSCGGGCPWLTLGRGPGLAAFSWGRALLGHSCWYPALYGRRRLPFFQ